MKPILFLSALTFICTSLPAQVRIGVQSGANLSTFRIVDRQENLWGETYKTSSLKGLHCGLVIETAVSRNIFFQAGLLLSGHGSVVNSQSFFDTSERAIEIYYLEIPVSVLYKKKVAKESFVYAGLGLYAGRAVRGIEHGTGKDARGDYYIDSKVNFSNENAGHIFPTVIKPFDWGSVATAGYQYKRFQFSFNCKAGLASILPDSKIYGHNYKTFQLCLGVSYFIFNLN